MAKISAYGSLAGSGVDIAADVLPIVDTSVTTTKKILVSNLLGAAYTTAGDIVQASAAGVAARLALGTARQVPTVNAGATALAYANPITITAEQASTSGTAITFSSIPAGVRRVTMMLKGVSTNGTNYYLVQLGDAGGVETSGYLGSSTGLANAGAVAVANSTAALLIPYSSASNVLHGTVIWTLEDASDFSWTGIAIIGSSDSASIAISGCSKSLSQELDRIVITTVGGTDTFDAGVISVSYE